jgi:hypothetical protein
MINCGFNLITNNKYGGVKMHEEEEAYMCGRCVDRTD